jgi:hypothetical protein
VKLSTSRGNTGMTIIIATAFIKETPTTNTIAFEPNEWLPG